MPIIGITAGVGSKPVVTGGTLASDSTYYYRTFTANGTLTVSGSDLIADLLVIAGGASGGTGNLTTGLEPEDRVRVTYGAGGSGGVLYQASVSLLGSKSVTIGGGGASQTILSNGNAGSNSNFDGVYTSIGGGSGGNSGGSGGGGYSNYTTDTSSGFGQSGGAGTSGQGNAGGNGFLATSLASVASGGGGGAGATGSNGTSTVGGNGGNGTSTYSSWGSATSTGQNISGTYWFAGGGGGGANSSGTGGNGGGTAGNNGASSSSASANTGGGSGSTSNGTNSTIYSSGNGGSGIVIVRYTKAQVD